MVRDGMWVWRQWAETTAWAKREQLVQASCGLLGVVVWQHIVKKLDVLGGGAESYV